MVRRAFLVREAPSNRREFGGTAGPASEDLSPLFLWPIRPEASRDCLVFFFARDRGSVSWRTSISANGDHGGESGLKKRLQP